MLRGHPTPGQKVVHPGEDLVGVEVHALQLLWLVPAGVVGDTAGVELLVSITPDGLVPVQLPEDPPLEEPGHVTHLPGERVDRRNARNE